MENNEIIKEDLNIKSFEQFNQLNEAESLVLENIGEFVSKIGVTTSDAKNTDIKQDVVSVDSSDIEKFKNDQREILNKYPSLSDSDRENIFNKMDKTLTNSLGEK